jgi:hypothetical protein
LLIAATVLSVSRQLEEGADMSVATPERTVDEIVAGWRRGLDEDGLENPAGPLFFDEYAEFDLTRTGGATKDPFTMGSVCTAGFCTFCC